MLCPRWLFVSSACQRCFAGIIKMGLLRNLHGDNGIRRRALKRGCAINGNNAVLDMMKKKGKSSMLSSRVRRCSNEIDSENYKEKTEVQECRG